MGSGGIEPHFLDIGTSLKWVVSFTPFSLNPRGKNPRYPWIGGWVGPRAGLDDVENRVLQPEAGRYPDSSPVVGNITVPAISNTSECYRFLKRRIYRFEFTELDFKNEIQMTFKFNRKMVCFNVVARLFWVTYFGYCSESYCLSVFYSGTSELLLLHFIQYSNIREYFFVNLKEKVQQQRKNCIIIWARDSVISYFILSVLRMMYFIQRPLQCTSRILKLSTLGTPRVKHFNFEEKLVKCVI
jgi:hypothetical protein